MFLAVVGVMTRFNVVSEEDPNWRALLKELDKDGQVLAEMVSKYHGGRPVKSREPEFIVMVNDVIDSISHGTQQDCSSEWGLAGTSALSWLSTFAISTTKIRTRWMAGKSSGILCAMHVATAHLQCI